MLAIDDLTVRYRTASGEIEALSSVTLQARKGSTLGLVGESGSGKSAASLGRSNFSTRSASSSPRRWRRPIRMNSRAANAPKHPYTIKLLSAVPRVDGPARMRREMAIEE